MPSKQALQLKKHPRFRRRLRGLERLEAREMMAADMVITWNKAVIDAQRLDTTHPGPGWSSRDFAMVHLAIYDAVNAITKTHSSYALTVEAPDTASKEAAVAQAARDTLAGIYPAQTAAFDLLLSTSLGDIPDGPEENAGIAIGKLAAAAILNLRVGDGSEVSSNYQVNSAPGHWEPDPLNPGQVAWGPDWGDVTPFGILSVDNFQVPPPPALNSAEYAAAYNEVKELGELTSTERTAEQTEIGLFWAYDRGGFGPPTMLYNKIVQSIAEVRGNTLEENSRLFALVTLAMADAGYAVWETKFDFDFWRPVTGIRRGAEDGNPNTIGDPTWIPLGAPGADPDPLVSSDDFTPPFPAYTSGHAGFGAATFKMLANFYGEDYFDVADNYDFSATSEEVPGVTRTFESFAQAAEENGRSRIYLGIHWEFDSKNGQLQGLQVADDVFANLLLPQEQQTLISLQRSGSGFRTVAIDAGADVVIRRKGNSLQIIDKESDKVLFQERLNDVAAIRIDGRNDAADRVKLDLAKGGVILPAIQIEYIGGEGDLDRFDVQGIEHGNNLCLNGDVFTIGGSALTADIGGVEAVGLFGGKSRNTLKVLGVQDGRTLDLAGGHKNDRYVIGSTGATVQVHDSRGGTLDFSLATEAAVVDLGLSRSQPQAGAAGNVLRLFCSLNNLVGSPLADILVGNKLDNVIHGLAGDDLIDGDRGADELFGGEDNDILLGGASNDRLDGQLGFDLVIGGQGRDAISARSGDDIVIGGTTAHDNHYDALRQVLAEWASPRSQTVRMANLTDGSGSLDRENGNVFLTDSANGTVRDDGVRDKFTFGPATNWIFECRSDQMKKAKKK